MAMNTGLPTVLGWDYHVHQRAQRWPDINKRKEDLKKLYTSDNQQVVARDPAQVPRRAGLRRPARAPHLQRRQPRALQGVDRPAAAGLLQRRRHRLRRAGPVRRRDSGQHHRRGAAGARRKRSSCRARPASSASRAASPSTRDGNAYVADFGNDRIQKFDPQLQFLKAWGERGDLPSQFKQPGAVAVGPDGLVYVADTWNQRVQVFTPDGEYKREWADKYYGPRGIAAAPSGAIYLADTGNHRVRKFSARRRRADELGRPRQGARPVHRAGRHRGRQGRHGLRGRQRQRAACRSSTPTASCSAASRSRAGSRRCSPSRTSPSPPTAPSGSACRCRASSAPTTATASCCARSKAATSLSLPFDRPMGLAYDARTDELVVVDLENRIVRVPAK